VLGLGAVIGLIGGAIFWITGPIVRKSDTDAAAMLRQITEIQDNTAAIKKRVDTIPSPFEFDQIRNQQAANQRDISEFNARLSALTATVNTWVNEVPRVKTRSDRP
jgi:predicted  nucleic acid-binding Zn-ribbon protein